MTPSEREEHPEELLHRARVGLPLSARERSLRIEHLRGCDVCRLLEETRSDLLEEAARPAGGKSITDLVAATMASYEATEAPRPPSSRGPRRGYARHPARTVVLAAVAVCAVTGVALAARWIVEARTAGRAGVTPARVAAHAPRTGVRRASAPHVAAEAAATTEQLPPMPAPEDAAAGDASAAALFARATEARRAGRADDARRAYEHLWRAYPTTLEARTGRVAYGRWLLDRHEPAPAAVAFGDYLRSDPHGTLSAEARVGLSEALELLGDRARARRAWQDVLDDPAAGTSADHAKARLRSLDGGGRAGAP